VQRHYERLTSFPEGFLVVGDALCTFNPIHAQGMSAAARQARLLHDVLAEHLTRPRGLENIAPAFFVRAAELNSTPWNLAAGFDFAFPQTRGERPPGIQERARYFAALDRLQVDDREVQRLVAEVFHLMRPISALQEEPLRSRVLARL
jgi:2-polyprenyl-6-methoxyphenol hydroxylase-like FAD-dependent oxidoreductase